MSFFSDNVILFVSNGYPTDKNTSEESIQEIVRVITKQKDGLRNQVNIQTFRIGPGKKIS